MTSGPLELAWLRWTDGINVWVEVFQHYSDAEETGSRLEAYYGEDTSTEAGSGQCSQPEVYAAAHAAALILDSEGMFAGEEGGLFAGSVEGARHECENEEQCARCGEMMLTGSDVVDVVTGDDMHYAVADWATLHFACARDGDKAMGS